jgi:predicted HicB family RNase H-like nuclease
MAEEARTLWIETEYEAGEEIPLPTRPSEYSGKFNLRLPKSLHARLAASAEQEGVSLNQYVLALLAASEATARGASKTETARSIGLRRSHRAS